MCFWAACLLDYGVPAMVVFGIALFVYLIYVFWTTCLFDHSFFPLYAARPLDRGFCLPWSFYVAPHNNRFGSRQLRAMLCLLCFPCVLAIAAVVLVAPVGIGIQWDTTYSCLGLTPLGGDGYP